ncbi:MAG: ABC transporter permease [Acaryochloridaceae cyanobacterium SU_2_1]|nr:ABC transporter permease [Acaryochloridaceae cyanobacterium SU_2_1]
MTSARFRWPKRLRFWHRRSLSYELMWIGLWITVIYILAALLAPQLQAGGWLQSPSADDSLGNIVHAPPSAQYWFGTDREGVDVFARTVYGAQAALQVVIAATFFSLLLGVPLGLVSGYLGATLDRILVFVMDAIYTLPGLLLAVTLAFGIGEAARGVLGAAVAISVAYIPQYYRVVRNHTVSIKTELFVEAARALGASPWRVLTRYLFGNIIQSVPVLFTLNAADAILTLGSLGFLGLGLPPGSPEWGNDLRQALDALSTGDIWWTSLYPGLAMTLLVVGLSLVGEGLNEFVNPLLKGDSQRPVGD